LTDTVTGHNLSHQRHNILCRGYHRSTVSAAGSSDPRHGWGGPFSPEKRGARAVAGSVLGSRLVPPVARATS